MRVVDPSVELECLGNPLDIMKHIEKVGRTCYKSEDKITDDSYAEFIKRLVRRGHGAMLEHGSITASFVVDRGVSHEMVRHRLASFAQESTRYCNYKDKGCVCVKPVWFSWEEAEKLFDNMEHYRRDPSADMKLTSILLWYDTNGTCANSYRDMLRCRRSPQEARGVLPHALATAINVTANLREWRTIFSLRCAPDAHPDMRYIMLQTLEKMYALFPPVFEDLYAKYFPQVEVTNENTSEEVVETVLSEAE